MSRKCELCEGEAKTSLLCDKCQSERYSNEAGACLLCGGFWPETSEEKYIKICKRVDEYREIKKDV